MTDTAQWHAEADRLKKCVDYAPTESDAFAFRIQLANHLHKKPLEAVALEAVDFLNFIAGSAIGGDARGVKGTDARASDQQEDKP